MSKEFINNRVDVAHNLIDEGQYQGAVELLKNLKVRIHDAGIEISITEFEKTHDSDKDKQIASARQTTGDPIEINAKEALVWSRYAKAYLNFYDKLTKEHEVY